MNRNDLTEERFTLAQSGHALYIVVALLLGLASMSAAEGQNANGRYQLGSGDVISIRVFGEDQLSFDRIRLSDGATVPYPFLGEVKAEGRTPVELEELIVKGLKGDYLINPRVTVNVIEYRQFYINGEVKDAGGYDFQPGMTVRKAIALAGGLTDRASSNKMLVTREGDPKGRERSVELDTRLRPGDILTIDESFF